jgi:hypothetical protein
VTLAGGFPEAARFVSEFLQGSIPMKVRVRREYLGKEGRVKKGDILEISEQRFRELSEGIHAANPLVDPVEVGYKMQSAPQNKMAAEHQNKDAGGTSIHITRRKEGASAAAAGPSISRPTGGQTGAANAPSSSAQGRQPASTTLPSSESVAGSSPSTTPGGSSRSPRSSTHATSRTGKGGRASRSSKV